MTGTIFNIQKFCVNDGPGIRTAVFIKGCPLSCAWCHNPESQSPNAEIMFYANKCIGCGKCAALCKNNCHTFENGVHKFARSGCIGCFECLKPECGALERAGKQVTADEVMAEVLKDKAFYENSGGGMTLSGGEPLYACEFSMELLKKARENGINTAVETCGFAPPEHIKQIAEYTDLFLFDFKLTDPALHKKYTGADNRLIIENLGLLSSMGKDIILRCPIIPGVNDNKAHFDGICALANRLDGIKHIELEPYHSMGENKYVSLGLAVNSFGKITESEKESWLTAVKSGTKKEVKFA